MSIWTTENLCIEFEESKEKYFDMIKKWAVDAYKKHQKYFDIKPKLKIKLIYTRKKFDSLMPADRPEEMKKFDAGLAPEAGKLYIFSPTVIEQLTIHKKEEAGKTISHEMCHLFHRNIVGDSFLMLPTWWTEGLACFLSDMIGPLSSIPDIFKLTPFNVCEPEMKFSYRTSAVFIKFITQKYGIEKIKALIKVKNAVSFNKLWFELFNKHAEDVFEEFKCQMNIQ